MVVVGQAGFGWLRVETFRPVVGVPTFVRTQYGHKEQLVLGVGEH